MGLYRVAWGCIGEKGLNGAIWDYIGRYMSRPTGCHPGSEVSGLRIRSLDRLAMFCPPVVKTVHVVFCNCEICLVCCVKILTRKTRSPWGGMITMLLERG